jgi:hypothetical protein
MISDDYLYPSNWTNIYAVNKFKRNVVVGGNMADITMCVVKDCPLEKSCYRKTAKQSVWQSVSEFEVYLDREKEVCEMYYEGRGDE